MNYRTRRNRCDLLLVRSRFGVSASPGRIRPHYVRGRIGRGQKTDVKPTIFNTCDHVIAERDRITAAR
jgi:hypothetical protein